jgi:hypothetical protein
MDSVEIHHDEGCEVDTCRLQLHINILKMKISMGANPVSELDTKHGDRPSLRTEEVGLVAVDELRRRILVRWCNKKTVQLANLARARQLSKHLAAFDLTLSPTTENP